jgi:hypothetical protein
MGGVVVYSPRSTDSSSADGSGDEGGNMEDILKRLGTVETNVLELKSQLSAILAIIPHLATKADVADLRTDVAQLRGDMSAGIAGLEARIIKWIVATLLTSTGLAFTIAKFVH